MGKVNNKITISELVEAREIDDNTLEKAERAMDKVVEEIDKEVTEEAPKREIIIDRGGGQIHVTNSNGGFLRLVVNGKVVDSQKPVNGICTLRFPNGWPQGDFQYEVQG